MSDRTVTANIRLAGNGYVVEIHGTEGHGVAPDELVYRKDQLPEMLERVAHSLDPSRMVKVLSGDDVAAWGVRIP